MKLGRAYECGVETSAPIETFLKRHLIEVNFGDMPFYYPLPEGYSAWRGAPLWVDVGSTDKTVKYALRIKSVGLASACSATRRWVILPAMVVTNELFSSARAC